MMLIDEHCFKFLFGNPLDFRNFIGVWIKIDIGLNDENVINLSFGPCFIHSSAVSHLGDEVERVKRNLSRSDA